jgi:proteasome lid subunit RPN8/RPN11
MEEPPCEALEGITVGGFGSIAAFWGGCENSGMLVFDPHAYSALRCHGEGAYPEESCGVLVGRLRDGGAAVASAIRCENIRRDSPRNRYAIDPKELVRIQREARVQGLEIVGFYHSHPDHPAEWSSTDLAEAYWVGCSYVITRVANGRAEETRSFRLEGSWEEKRFVEEEVVKG